jgi:hypothetical protein
MVRELNQAVGYAKSDIPDMFLYKLHTHISDTVLGRSTGSMDSDSAIRNEFDQENIPFILIDHIHTIPLKVPI